MIRLKGKRLRWAGSACLVLGVVIVFVFSNPVRIRYHKWRLIAAKQEHLRLARGEYRFTDQMRELLLGKPVTWAEVEARWKHHEEALVQAGFLKRVEYYPRRGKLPSKANKEFAAILQQMDGACPHWSYRASKSETSLTVTASQEGLELWKKLAPTIGLREEKPTKEGHRRGNKCGRRSRERQPVSVEWSSMFGRPQQQFQR